MADHYAVLARAGKPVPKAPELPPEAVHVWNAFVALSSARTSNGFGPNPITFMEIEAFNRLTGDGLTPWEVEAIRELDDAFLAVAMEGGRNRSA